MKPFRILIACLIQSATLSTHASDYVSRSGEELYNQFCASCHGIKGQGDGPVSKSLRVEVPDLTLLARRHRGSFPREQVEKIIDGRFLITAHGTRVMPVWGERFSKQELGNPDAEKSTRVLTGRLADYVWSLQRPDPNTQSDSSSSGNTNKH